MKAYLEVPFLEDWRRVKFKNIRSLWLPIGIYGGISWSDYDFECCDSGGYFPKGRKDGKHKFSISFGIMYWSIKLIFYKPK